MRTQNIFSYLYGPTRIYCGRELKSCGLFTAKDDSFIVLMVHAAVMFVWVCDTIYQGVYLCSVQFRNLAQSVNFFPCKLIYDSRALHETLTGIYLN